MSKKQQGDLQLLMRLWLYVKPSWPLILLGALLIPVALLFELAQPYLLKVAIEKHIEPKLLSGLEGIVFAYIGCVVAYAFASFAQQYCLQLVGQKAMHRLRKGAYQHVMGQGRSFFDHTPIGTLLTRLTTDVESINEMFANGVITLIADLLKLLAILGVMFYLSVELTLVVLVTLPLLMVIVNYARKLMRTSFRIIRHKLAAMNAHMQEHLSGLAVVQLFQMERDAKKSFVKENSDFRDAYHTSNKADATIYALVEAVSIMAIALVAWYATGDSETAFSVALIIAFIEYINKFFLPVRDLSAKYGVMQSAMAAIERLSALLDSQVDDAPVIERPTTSSKGLVEFREVCFAYRLANPILHDISFSVPQGTHIALVGATGSGKSTIIKLLTRLYDPQEGAIFLAGRNIASLEGTAVRKQITTITQDTFLFNGTLGSNLRAGTTASDEEILAVLSELGGEELLMTKEDGSIDLTRAVSSRGANLSAGQRQLVAFARALLRRTEILILDEATAQIDPHSERIIEKALEALTKNRTTISIAHRLSTIRRADTILVLRKGMIVEHGTYDELVAQKGVFAALEKSFSRSS